MTLALAMVLDAIFGEPKLVWDRFPHPAVMMGRAIGWSDKTYNTGGLRRLKGAILVVGLTIFAALTGWLIEFVWVFEVLTVAVLLAQKSLVQHVNAVADALNVSVEHGRKSVAMIVGRDTSEMDESAIARAAIESAAENFSDGVIAPLFWYLIAGLPGLLIYKVINTADSMIGYRTERHAEFGWAAARFDDVLNWVPARLTAILIAGITGNLKQWRDVTKDARLHRSPNAGWPEAAMSRAIDVSLSGPRSYDGVMQDFPFVNPKGRRNVTASDIQASTRILWLSWASVLVGALLLAFLA